MTPDEARENAKTMLAWADGATIEFWNVNEWSPASTPQFAFHNTKYRIKPTPKTRAWTAEDVPMPVCWVRENGMPGLHQVVGVCPECVKLYDGRVTYEGLATGWHYSTDGRTWLPCVVTEGA